MFLSCFITNRHFVYFGGEENTERSLNTYSKTQTDKRNKKQTLISRRGRVQREDNRGHKLVSVASQINCRIGRNKVCAPV